MSVSPYFSDDTVIASLRKYYNENERYNINFRYWLHTAKIVENGVIIRVSSRKFLIDYFTGSIVMEVK